MVRTGVTPQGRDITAEEKMGPAQYKRATLRSLQNVLADARSKLSAAHRPYKCNLDCQVSLRPVVHARDCMHLHRPPRALSEAEMRNPGHFHGNTADASHKLLPKFQVPYCVRPATDTVLNTVWDGLTTSVSADRVTMVRACPFAAQSSAIPAGEADS